MITIMMKPNACDELEMVPHKYQVITAGRAIIRNMNGTYALIGYGIGDIIEVLHGTMQYLNMRSEYYDELPLADGTFMIAHDDMLAIGGFTINPEVPTRGA